jgi:hypothetical protein
VGSLLMPIPQQGLHVSLDRVDETPDGHRFAVPRELLGKLDTGYQRGDGLLQSESKWAAGEHMPYYGCKSLVCTCSQFSKHQILDKRDCVGPPKMNDIRIS